MYLYYATGVEKLNDVSKRSYFSSCKWNPAEEMMLTEQRMGINSLLSRKRRAYMKHNHKYWDQGIIQTRKQRRKCI